MDSTILYQLSPDAVRAMIAEEVSKAVAAIQPQPKEELLTTEEAMQFLNIRSRVGFKSWCVKKNVFGKPCGKRKMFLQSQILSAL